jgi:fluoride ion exporter CrcB/FEX
MERLDLVLMVGVGACLGSALRHSTSGRIAKRDQLSNPLPRLLVTAAGSFLAGQLTGYLLLISQTELSSGTGTAVVRNGGFLLAGILGGYVTFPASTREPVTGGGTPRPGITPFRLLSSLIAAIIFFCAGALLVR